MLLTILAHFAVRLAKAVAIAVGVAALFNAMDGLQGGDYVEINTVLVFLLIVSLITALQLALDMLPTHTTVDHIHRIRDNRMVKPQPKPQVSWTPVETPDGFYNLTVQIDDPFTDWPLTKQRLRMMIHTLLANSNGHASNNFMPGYTEQEVKIFREWLLHRGYAKKVRGSAVLLPEKRGEVIELLPHLGSQPR